MSQELVDLTLHISKERASADNKITSYQCILRYTDLFVYASYDFRPLQRLISVWDFIGTSFAYSIRISDHSIVPLWAHLD